MNSSNLNDLVARTRRNFLATSASGVGTLALANLLQGEGLLGAEGSAAGKLNPLAPKPPHFAPKAKNCIFLFMAGAPSQLDLFDPKPKLDEWAGRDFPEKHGELSCNVHHHFRVTFVFDGSVYGFVGDNPTSLVRLCGCHVRGHVLGGLASPFKIQQ